MISATAIIAKQLGVTQGVAVVIKYTALTAVVGGSLWWMKADYDSDRRQEGYDKCKTEQLDKSMDVAEVADEVTDERDEAVRDGKTRQRTEDTVTRERFDELKTEKDNDRITFERLLAQAMARTNSDGSVNCANQPMPDQLQRRVGPERITNGR